MLNISKTKLRYTLYVVAVCAIVFGFVGAAYNAEAAESQPEYLLLAPLPDGTDSIPAGGALGDYLSTIFAFGIGAAGVLAVLMLVIAGIEYMSPSSQSKSDAKDRITSALGGLLLALGSWLILNTINPDLLTDFSVPKIVIQEGKDFTDRN